MFYFFQDEELGAGVVLNRAMRSVLRAWGSRYWKHDTAKHSSWHGVNASPLELIESKQTSVPEVSRYYVNFMPLLSEQPQSKARSPVARSNWLLWAAPQASGTL